MEKEKVINEVIENFDFEKVHKVMTFLNWTWQDEPEVPTVGRLMISAQKRLNEAFDKCTSSKRNYYSNCGGFRIHANYDNDECDCLELIFQLTSWEYYED